MGAREHELSRQARPNVSGLGASGTLVRMAKRLGCSSLRRDVTRVLRSLTPRAISTSMSDSGRCERPTGVQPAEVPPVTQADLTERFAGDECFRAMLAERWEALEERVRSQA